MLDIITCCNDPRIDDLKRLIHSIEAHAPSARLRVIAFDEDITMTERIVRNAGGTMLACDPLWSALGQRLFHGRGHYRPGVPMWMYFHKLNMFNEVNGPTVYLDANSVLLSGETPPTPGANEILFHSIAMRGRNIPERSQFVRAWAPEINEGFNLGYCHFGPKVADLLRQFAAIVQGLHGAFLGPAPEQSFLTYAMAFLDIHGRLLHDLDPGIAPTNNGSLPIEQDAQGIYRYVDPPFGGQRVLSAKRPGSPEMDPVQRRLFGQFD